MSVVRPKINIQPVQENPAELFLIEAELRAVLNRAQGIIKDACITLLEAGGKRLRPLLVIYSAKCFGPITNSTVYAATAAELIHMASLVHDDVIDGSRVRRGKATINALHGNQAAVLTGDYLFAEAFRILSHNQLLPSMRYLVEAIQEMCDGEVNQARDLFVIDKGLEGYFSRIGKKTSQLLAASCQSGGSTAGVNGEELNILGQYGMNLGYAFQIVDDVLDFVGSPQQLGKPVGLDITSGNITLPIILLLKDPVYGPWLTEILKSKTISPKGLESIKEALVSTGCIEQSYVIAAQCIDKAKTSLEKLPAGPYRNKLWNLADMVLKRQA